MDSLIDLSSSSLKKLGNDELKATIGTLLEAQAEIRKENQILYYEAASPSAEQVHLSTAHTIGAGGGNRSSKTESMLVESIACATGVFPDKYRDVFLEKFRGPINVRICIESLTTILHPVLLPKLQWWKWTGYGDPGGDQGHWGWVPRMCLRGRDWSKSWIEKLRTLTVLCRNPENLEEVLGESVIQILSYDQESTDYASGTFHIVHMDEPPPYPIWAENKIRTMDVRGRIFLSMTWPDDPSIGVDWIYDEVYEPGQPGLSKDPDVDWFVLKTYQNKFIDQESVRLKTKGLSEEDRKVRIEGEPLRFSNRIHPLFTDVEQNWCFTCGKNCNPEGQFCGCPQKSIDICEYIHIQQFEVKSSWPSVYLLDPHPRKPHFMAWVMIDPSDDLYLVNEAEIEGDAPDVKAFVADIEQEMGLDVRLRLMDPNMGSTPTARREVSWQDEFNNAGLAVELADKSEVGRKKVDQYLKPDHYTRRPRLIFHQRCRNAAMQMKRFVWGEFKRSLNRDQKQSPQPKYDDYPALLRYLMNSDPCFKFLYQGAPIVRRKGVRRGAY